MAERLETVLEVRNFQALYQFEGSLFAGFRFHEERRKDGDDTARNLLLAGGL